MSTSRELCRIQTPGRDVVVRAESTGDVLLVIELCHGGPRVVALLDPEQVAHLGGALLGWAGVRDVAERLGLL